MSDDSETPRLCGLVVHWHDLPGIEALAESWPQDPTFELLVIDNSGDAKANLPSGRILSPGANLGFAGAINFGIQQTRAPIVLVLNSDCRPQPGALEELLAGFETFPDIAGLVPSLHGEDGLPQHAWQLRPLPKPWQLLAIPFIPNLWSGAVEAPPPGEPVEQPAGAALALKRSVLLGVGGFDTSFYPAWFEDVDLAQRLKALGESLLYWPGARFVHRLGTSVDPLGYPAFLWLHYRNLWRYLHKHHGAVWAAATRLTLPVASLIRCVGVLLRRPKRARSRREAAAGLCTVAIGALSRWQRPRDLVRQGSPPATLRETF